MAYVAANMEPGASWQAQTDAFLKATNITVCGNDYVGTNHQWIRNLFAPPNSTNVDPRPVFVAINGLSNAPNRRQWEVLINDSSNGGGARDYSAALLRWRTILDSVQAPPPTLTNLPAATGAFAFAYPGQQGHTNVVEASSNLLDWVTSSSSFGTNGPVTIRDTNAVTTPQRFYRIRRL